MALGIKFACQSTMKTGFTELIALPITDAL